MIASTKQWCKRDEFTFAIVNGLLDEEGEGCAIEKFNQWRGVQW
jgi:hypothetical protein